MHLFEGRFLVLLALAIDRDYGMIKYQIRRAYYGRNRTETAWAY